MTEITNPVAALQIQAKKLDYKALKAKSTTERGRKDVNRGGVTFRDLPRMDFIINGTSIDRNFVNQLHEIYGNSSIKDAFKDYRPFAKEIFGKMFAYARANVPNDSILEELVTNCNQAGYEGTLFTDVLFQAFNQSEFILLNPQKKININCTDPNYVKVKSEMTVPAVKSDNPEEEVGQIDSLLEFILESQNDQDWVTYKAGKLSLTVPRELENDKADDKSLFDMIKDYFYGFCEKLGFFKIKIEHNLGDPLKVNSRLESVKPPIHSNEHVPYPG